MDTTVPEETPRDRSARYADAGSEARNQVMLANVRQANSVLDSIAEPAVGWLNDARSVLDRLAESSRSEPLWRALEEAAQRLHSAARRGDAGTVDPEDLVRLKEAGKSGSYHALMMAAIVEADAPICASHGPMALIGSDWLCAADTTCTDDFWDFDGTYCARP